MLVGRTRERRRIEQLLADARQGRSGALLLHGDPGIGKTALLRWTLEQADGFRVLHARGIETESDIPFAGLGELVSPLLDRLDDIPAVQAAALRGALALGPAGAPDRFTVPAGLLSLLAVAAEAQPVLAMIDDVQWLDEPSVEALLFAGRRLGAEGVAMLGALRDSTPVARMEAPWLERLPIGPLDDEEARAVLVSDEGSERIAPAVADRLVGTAGGNPLALVELPNVLSDAQLSGREPLEELLRPGATVERAFRMRLDALDKGARRALLIAATAHSLRIDVIQAAVRAAGLAMSDLAAAEDARLVSCAAASSSSAIRCCARPPTTPRRPPSAAPPTRRWPTPLRRAARRAPGISRRRPSRPTRRSPAPWRRPRSTRAAAARTRPPHATSHAPPT
jgi:hypothetical protein